MKSLLRSSLLIGTIAGAAALAPVVANAGVSIGIGVPAVIVGAGPGYVAYDDQYYYDPIYISGAWYHGPYRWRMWHGERMFFVNGRWQRNEWRERRVPESIVFRNGGSFRNGRYEGFNDAQRLDARFRAGGRDMGADHRDMRNDRSDMQQDRSDMRQDRTDMRQDRQGGEEDKDGDRQNDGGGR